MITTNLAQKYKTIVIDPPWAVGNGFDKKYCFHGQNREQCLPYQTMSDTEILAFPINNFAAEDCDLFLWTTHTKLPTALNILQAWGFKYHALMAWDKANGVCINGFYRNTELIVYGYRGKMGIDVSEGNYIPTLFKEQSRNHSRKPDVFYSILRKRTQEPRIDIFARYKHVGFDVWGNEAEEPLTLMEACVK